MMKNTASAVKFGLSLTSIVLLASCTTSEYAKVQSVVPKNKPTAEEVAMLSTLSSTDTSGAVTTETAQIDFKPVDYATNPEVAMAYAVPEPRPGAESALAVQAAMPEITLTTPVATTTATEGVMTQTADLAAQPGPLDPLASPELSASAALAEVPKTRSLEPFAAATSNKNGNLNQLIAKYAALYDVPERLVHHVVRRETNYNPSAVHRGNWGLMQIRYNTAKGLGYDGSPNGLLDAETNLKYAVKYLRGAYLVSGRDETRADWLYRTGYYYEAKKLGLLEEAGLR